MGDHVDAVIGQLTERVVRVAAARAVARPAAPIYSQYAVGFDNVDVEAATAPRAAGRQHARAC